METRGGAGISRSHDHQVSFQSFTDYLAVGHHPGGVTVTGAQADQCR